MRFSAPIVSQNWAADWVTKQLEAENGVTKVRVNPAAASLVVRHERTISQDALRLRIEELIEKAASRTTAISRLPSAQSSGSSRWLRVGAPATFALVGALLGASVPVPLIIGAIALAAAPIARRASHSIRVERRLNIDVLDLAAIVLTTLRGSFIAPVAMISLVEIGEAIRERTARASEREVIDLLGSMSQFVWLQRGEERDQVPIEAVGRGDVVVLYPGDRVPIDGHVLEGSGYIDEHQLTGESMPSLRTEGQAVFASTLVREGHLHVRVEHVGDETRAGRIVRLMQDAPIHDTRIENYAAKIADRIVLPTFLLAGCVLVLTRNPARAAPLLITDLMTGVRVSVPTTVLAALTAAARRGILIRSGRALEKLAAVDTIVFDKTGTVTIGEPTVVDLNVIHPEFSAQEVLKLAATAEQRLTHPVAEAVVRYASQHGVKPGRRHDWHYDIGLGVSAQINNRTVYVGSDRLFERVGINLNSYDLKHSRSNGQSQIYIGQDHELVGVLAYADPPRNESQEVITALQDELAMDIHLLTGDKGPVAKAIASTIGIETVNTHAELFPEEKAAVVRELRAEGRNVAFVGDGVNDLPALAYADVSVSFGGATDVARETADIVLMDNDLRGLPEAIAIARRALTICRQNIGVVAGTNLTALGVATAGVIGPVSAAVVHNGSTIVAALNGLRLLNGVHQGRFSRRVDIGKIEEQNRLNKVNRR